MSPRKTEPSNKNGKMKETTQKLPDAGVNKVGDTNSLARFSRDGKQSLQTKLNEVRDLFEKKIQLGGVQSAIQELGRSIENGTTLQDFGIPATQPIRLTGLQSGGVAPAFPANLPPQQAPTQNSSCQLPLPVLRPQLMKLGEPRLDLPLTTANLQTQQALIQSTPNSVQAPRPLRPLIQPYENIGLQLPPIDNRRTRTDIKQYLHPQYALPSQTGPFSAPVAETNRIPSSFEAAERQDMVIQESTTPPPRPNLPPLRNIPPKRPMDLSLQDSGSEALFLPGPVDSNKGKLMTLAEYNQTLMAGRIKPTVSHETQHGDPTPCRQGPGIPVVPSTAQSRSYTPETVDPRELVVPDVPRPEPAQLPPFGYFLPENRNVPVAQPQPSAPVTAIPNLPPHVISLGMQYSHTERRWMDYGSGRSVPARSAPAALIGQGPEAYIHAMNSQHIAPAPLYNFGAQISLPVRPIPAPVTPPNLKRKPNTSSSGDRHSARILMLEKEKRERGQIIQSLMTNTEHICTYVGVMTSLTRAMKQLKDTMLEPELPQRVAVVLQHYEALENLTRDLVRGQQRVTAGEYWLLIKDKLQKEGNKPNPQ